MNDSNNFRVYLDNLPDLPELERSWLQLETKSDTSIFQSWIWQRSWLSILPDHLTPKLIRVENNSSVVGMGLILESRLRKRLGFTTKALHLSETGNSEFDAITIEHNGFLIESGQEEPAINAICMYLSDSPSYWDEFYISGVSNNTTLLQKSARQNGLLIHSTAVQTYYYVPLDNLENGHDSYLAALSSNTRYQIRRSTRAYEAGGSLCVTAAENVSTALNYLDKLKQLHQAYWTEKGQPGAFSNDNFNKFHDALIRTGFDSGHIQMLRISVGDEDLGYLYNLHKDGVVSSYQSGFVYGKGSKFKPGMVSHSMAIAYNIEQGMRTYDYLMGDSQYKSSMSTQTGEMQWLCFQRNKLLFQLESMIRRLRSK